MNKIKYLFFLCCINLSFAADWFNEWFLPDPGLFIWTVITFLIVLAILRWKAWGPLMDALDARAKQIEESLSKAEKVSAAAEQQAEKNEEILNDEKFSLGGRWLRGFDLYGVGPRNSRSSYVV